MLDSLETESSQEEVSTDLNGATEDTESTQEEVGTEESLVYELDDKTYTVEELRNFRDSGLRQDDYTKKTMKLSDDSKALEAERNALLEKVSVVDGLEKDLMDLVSSGVDSSSLDDLRQDDPSEYLRVTKLIEDRNKKLQEIFDKGASLKSELMNKEQAVLSERLGWHDQSKMAEDQQLLSGLIRSRGFTDADLRSLSSANVAHALLDLAKFERVKQSADKKKAKPAAPKTAKPTKQKQQQNGRIPTAQLLYGD